MSRRGHRSLARQFDEPDTAPIVVRRCACGVDFRVSYVVVEAVKVFNARLEQLRGYDPIDLLALPCPACEERQRAAGTMSPAQAQVAIERLRAGGVVDAATATGLVTAGYAIELAMARARQAQAAHDQEGDA